MHPVQLHDQLTFSRVGRDIKLTCNLDTLPTDSQNLVYRAAEIFLRASSIKEGISMHLDKRIPLAAGLGGGSGNAATTLTGLNELFGSPLPIRTISSLAESLGSDVPFFLQERPALATGRGERIQSLDFFPALRGKAFVLVHPGFGIASSWAYQQLNRFPQAQNGRPGRAQKLIELLRGDSLPAAGLEFYNSLEAPALEKYPLLTLFQEFFRENGVLATLMSGSGSTTFAIANSQQAAEELAEKIKKTFGPANWTAAVSI
jgi:4-diphosphocytidyl-2-C-methyl-D-erythritol kinase